MYQKNRPLKGAIHTDEDLNPHPLGAQRSNLIHLAQLTFGLSVTLLRSNCAKRNPLKTEPRKRGLNCSRV
jgi:hypothetical protein